MECTGVPVARCSASALPVARRRRAMSAARVSAQLSAGVSGSPEESRASRVCSAALKDRATTVRPRPAQIPALSRTASTTPASTASGSWTASPPRPVCRGAGRSTVETTRYAPSTATTLVAVVPRSIPSTTWVSSFITVRVSVSADRRGRLHLRTVTACNARANILNRWAQILPQGCDSSPLEFSMLA